METVAKIGRAVASIAVANRISLVAFLFVMLAPIGVFELMYGSRLLRIRLGHEAAFIFFGGGMAAIFSFALIGFLSLGFYNRFTRNLSAANSD